jgi:hypothetical protein
MFGVDGESVKRSSADRHIAADVSDKAHSWTDSARTESRPETIVDGIVQRKRQKRLFLKARIHKQAREPGVCGTPTNRDQSGVMPQG